MAEKQGFANAPNVTTYAVGMRIKRNRAPWDIVAVRDTGFALGHAVLDHLGTDVLDHEYPGYLPKVFRPEEIYMHELDPNSIWVGRKYVCKASDEIITVRCIDEKQVCFEFDGRGDLDECPREIFQRDFTLYSPPKPPCKVGDIVLFESATLKRMVIGYVQQVGDIAIVIHESGGGSVSCIWRETKITLLVPEID
jgi:hypothetical protein